MRFAIAATAALLVVSPLTALAGPDDGLAPPSRAASEVTRIELGTEEAPRYPDFITLELPSGRVEIQGPNDAEPNHPIRFEDVAAPEDARAVLAAFARARLDTLPDLVDVAPSGAKLDPKYRTVSFRWRAGLRDRYTTLRIDPRVKGLGPYADRLQPLADALVAIRAHLEPKFPKWRSVTGTVAASETSVSVKENGAVYEIANAGKFGGLLEAADGKTVTVHGLEKRSGESLALEAEWISGATTRAADPWDKTSILDKERQTIPDEPGFITIPKGAPLEIRPGIEGIVRSWILVRYKDRLGSARLGWLKTDQIAARATWLDDASSRSVSANTAGMANELPMPGGR